MAGLSGSWEIPQGLPVWVWHRRGLNKVSVGDLEHGRCSNVLGAQSSYGAQPAYGSRLWLPLRNGVSVGSKD